MTDAITKLSPPDLDRLAAEVLGYTRGVSIECEPCWMVRCEDSPAGELPLFDDEWRPTQSHDQCQLLIDEIVRRGLVDQYIYRLEPLNPEYLVPPDWLPGMQVRLLRYLATATPLAKTQAAVAVLRKGE